MITLRFVTSSDLISATIRAFEYGFWATHVEALMPDGTLLGAHAEGGVQARPRDYDAAKFTREMFVPLSVDPVITEAFVTFLTQQVGKPYDFEAIAGIALGRDWRDPTRWFCSELQTSALEKCGFFPHPIADEIQHVTPRDLLMLVSAQVGHP